MSGIEPMTGREQGTRRRQRGWRIAAIATLAAAVLGLVGTALAPPPAPAAASSAAGISSTGQAAGPLTDASVTPKGWSPVAYENAQLSVPGSWLVESPQQFFCGMPQISGMIFVGVTQGFPKSFGCDVPANLAWILPAG